MHMLSLTVSLCVERVAVWHKSANKTRKSIENMFDGKKGEHTPLFRQNTVAEVER